MHNLIFGNALPVKCMRKGRPRHGSGRITEQEIDRLRELFPRLGTAATARELKRAKCTVRKIATRLGLREPRGAGWSAEHDDYVRANYQHISAELIGKRVGRTRNAVIGYANRIGLSSPQQKASKKLYVRKRGPRPQRQGMTWREIQWRARDFLAWRKREAL